MIYLVIYIKRATVILVIMTLVVIYLTMTLYNRSTKPAFSRENSYTVIIDAGHGNPDGGATGISGVGESEINLKISQKLSAKLKEKCYNVIMTRETADGIYSEGNSIKEKKLSDMHNRERIINGSGADIFMPLTFHKEIMQNTYLSLCRQCAGSHVPCGCPADRGTHHREP